MVRFFRGIVILEVCFLATLSSWAGEPVGMSMSAISSVKGEQMNTYKIASRLVTITTTVFKKQELEAAGQMMANDLFVRMRTDNEQESAAFEKVASRAEWEAFRHDRLEAMKRSVAVGREHNGGEVGGTNIGYEVTSTVEGDGFRVENLVIAGKPGLPITANLYVPSAPTASMPGILLASSHHNTKWQDELQDMGMTWARQGCLVMVVCQIGYGEERQQFFGGREDYRWRYYMGMQLCTVGESLLDWMVADLRRGLDVLVTRPGVDLSRIIAVGAVAGGGDLAAVLAATDNRVTCVVPYNYGSAEVVKNAATGTSEWVNAISSGDFDLVRCPYNSGRGGFTPWMVVAASAPRHVIFAKEFDWNPERDVGYSRISKVLGFYEATNRLASAHGYGHGNLPSTAASHCMNVSSYHRKKLYPILERWFNMPVPTEYRCLLKSEQLTCLTPAALERWPVVPVHVMLADHAAQQMKNARATLAALPAERRKEWLRKEWATRLGNVTPSTKPMVKKSESIEGVGFIAERLLLGVDPTMDIPVVFLKATTPTSKAAAKLPVVICVAQEGKDIFLARRALEIAEMLQRGLAVCIVDVRGTGETMQPGDRYWCSATVEVANRELMLGQTVLGSRVRDLRSVLRYLQSRPDVDPRRFAVWGESFAPVNSPKFIDPPMKADVMALQAEPMGSTAALLLALYEDDVKAVIGRGGLTGFAALMDGPASHVVLDAIVPKVTEIGDLADVVEVLFPRPVRLEALVDGRNRLADQDRLERDYAGARLAYRNFREGLTLTAAIKDDVAEWLEKAIKD